MEIKKISSLQHPLVKYLVDLRKSRKTRQENQTAFLSSKKVIHELIDRKAPIQTLFVQEGEKVDYPYETVEVSYAILKKITGLPEPEPLASTITMPSFQDVSKVSYLLVLDGIADPGNLGTLLRTALALGWQGIYLTENTCDPFHEKALRAAKGATFSIPIYQGTFEEFSIKFKHFQTFLADIEGTLLEKITPSSSPTALILSRESQGARLEAKKQFQTVCIPMNETMESLNVASAGAILLHGLKK